VCLEERVRGDGSEDGAREGERWWLTRLLGSCCRHGGRRVWYGAVREDSSVCEVLLQVVMFAACNFWSFNVWVELCDNDALSFYVGRGDRLD
jgi:hypothetical protein